MSTVRVLRPWRRRSRRACPVTQSSLAPWLQNGAFQLNWRLPWLRNGASQLNRRFHSKSTIVSSNLSKISTFWCCLTTIHRVDSLEKKAIVSFDFGSWHTSTSSAPTSRKARRVVQIKIPHRLSKQSVMMAHWVWLSSWEWDDQNKLHAHHSHWLFLFQMKYTEYGESRK